MFSMRLLSLATLVSLAYGHSQIINAQGIAGSPASVGFLGTIILIFTSSQKQ